MLIIPTLGRQISWLCCPASLANAAGLRPVRGLDSRKPQGRWYLENDYMFAHMRTCTHKHTYIYIHVHTWQQGQKWAKIRFSFKRQLYWEFMYSWLFPVGSVQARKMEGESFTPQWEGTTVYGLVGRSSWGLRTCGKKLLELHVPCLNLETASKLKESVDNKMWRADSDLSWCLCLWRELAQDSPGWKDMVNPLAFHWNPEEVETSWKDSNSNSKNPLKKQRQKKANLSSKIENQVSTSSSNESKLKHWI